MKEFWAYIDGPLNNVNMVKVLMDSGFNPHEVRTNAVGQKETPLSYLVSQRRMEEASAILTHPRFEYAVELAHYLHAVIDRVIQSENPRDYSEISEQMKNDLQLHEVITSYPTINALIDHLEPLVRHINRMAPAERRRYSQKMKRERFVSKVNDAAPGVSIDLEEGLDYDALTNYMDGDELIKGTALSVMIRKNMDANARVLLSKPDYQFISGSVLALRAAVRMKKDGLITLLMNALLKSEFTFSRKEIFDHFPFFHESGKTYIAIEMMNRVKVLTPQDLIIEKAYKIAVEAKAKPEVTAQEMAIYDRYINSVEVNIKSIQVDMTYPFNRLLEQLYLFSTCELESKLETSRPYLTGGYQETPCLFNYKRNGKRLAENVSAPDSEYEKGGRLAL